MAGSHIMQYQFGGIIRLIPLLYQPVGIVNGKGLFWRVLVRGRNRLWSWYHGIPRKRCSRRHCGAGRPVPCRHRREQEIVLINIHFLFPGVRRVIVIVIHCNGDGLQMDPSSSATGPGRHTWPEASHKRRCRWLLLRCQRDRSSGRCMRAADFGGNDDSG